MAEDGTLPTPVQVASKTEYDVPKAIGSSIEISSGFTGGTFDGKDYNAANEYVDSSGVTNAKAYNLKEWISTTLDNGGYYIARYEASQNGEKVDSKAGGKVWNTIIQPKASIAAQKTYADSIEANYYSDLINSYAWDTAIVFIEAYADTNYATKNNSTSFTTTGTNNDKVCNIYDMAANACEWTTETGFWTSNEQIYPVILRGACCYVYTGAMLFSAGTRAHSCADPASHSAGFRMILCVK